MFERFVVGIAAMVVALAVALVALTLVVNVNSNRIISLQDRVSNLEVRLADSNVALKLSALKVRFLEANIRALRANWNRKVTVTAYTPCTEETDQDPTITASMRGVRLGTVAVSRDLFDAGWTFGMRVYINGHGVFMINDLMNSRHKNRVDIFMWKKERAKRFGSKVVKVVLLRNTRT